MTYADIVSPEYMLHLVQRWTRSKGLEDAFHIDLRSAVFNRRRLPIVRIYARNLEAILELEDERGQTTTLAKTHLAVGYERLSGTTVGLAILHPDPVGELPPFIWNAGMQLEFFDLSKVSGLTTSERDVVSEMS